LKTFDLIDKLANLGEWKGIGIAEHLTWITEVEFREVIASSIPLFIEMLEHENGPVRSAIVELIGKLVNHGVWRLGSITAQLTHIPKSSFVKP
jgi:hypothetical protein